MYPTLFSLGPIALHTSSLFLWIGVVMAAFVIWKKTHSEHYEDDQVFDVLLLSWLAGGVLGRAIFALLHFSDFGLNLGKWLNIFSYPGFDELFTILGFCFVLAWSAKKQKWDHFEFLDFASSGITWGFVWIWIGRFLGGSFIGNPTLLPIGLRFPSVYDLRHPVQIYYTIAFVLLGLVITWCESRYRFFSWYRGQKQVAQSGFMFAVFLFGYSVIHLLIGQLHPASYTVSGVSLDIAVFLALLVSSLMIFYVRSGWWQKGKYRRQQKTSFSQTGARRLVVKRWFRKWGRG